MSTKNNFNKDSIDNNTNTKEIDMFNVSILSPYKSDNFNLVKSVTIKTLSGSYQFLSDHYNYATVTNFGECVIEYQNENKILTIFNGSVYFDNELNHLSLFCINFWLEKENITNYESILNTYKNIKVSSKEYISNFKLKFSKDHNIALEINYKK